MCAPVQEVEDDPRAMRRLRTEVEKAKRILSVSSSVQVELESFWQEQPLRCELSRAKFEQLCGPLFDKCIDVVRGVLKDAKVGRGDIDEIVLVRRASARSGRRYEIRVCVLVVSNRSVGRRASPSCRTCFRPSSARRRRSRRPPEPVRAATRSSSGGRPSSRRRAPAREPPSQPSPRRGRSCPKASTPTRRWRSARPFRLPSSPTRAATPSWSSWCSWVCAAPCVSAGRCLILCALPACALADVTPLSLGVEVEGGGFSVIVPRNSKVPLKKTHDYTTVYNNQTEIDIPVYEGERTQVPFARAYSELSCRMLTARVAQAKLNRLLGEFSLAGIPPAKKGVPKIDICFELDSNGILTVTASERATQAKAEITIRNDVGRLSDDEIRRMVYQAEANREADKQVRRVGGARPRAAARRVCTTACARSFNSVWMRATSWSSWRTT